MLNNHTSGNSTSFPDYFFIRKYLWSSSFYLHRYGSVLWIIAGLIFNILSFVTWTRPRLRRHNTSANYLAGISLADFCFWILYIMYYLKMSWDIDVQSAPVWCQMFQGLFLSMQYFSVPLVLVFSIERYIAVCHPFKRETLCTHKRALINTIVCGILVFILGFVQVISLTYDSASRKCIPRETVVFQQAWYIFATSIEFLLSALLPFSTLIVNILVIIELKAITNKTKLTKPTAVSPTVSSENPKDHLLPVNRSPSTVKDKQLQNQQSKEKSAFKSSTILLLSVSFLLIITTLPAGFVYALQFLSPNGNEEMSLDQMKRDPTWQRFAAYQAAKEFVDFLAMIHFVINFVIYYVTGDNFRTEFHRLFGCTRVSGNADENSNGGNSHSVLLGKSPGDTSQKRVDRTKLLRANPSVTSATNV